MVYIEPKFYFFLGVTFVTFRRGGNLLNECRTTINRPECNGTPFLTKIESVLSQFEVAYT